MNRLVLTMTLLGVLLFSGCGPAYVTGACPTIRILDGQKELTLKLENGHLDHNSTVAAVNRLKDDKKRLGYYETAILEQTKLIATRSTK